jgi:hypothetical protein
MTMQNNNRLKWIILGLIISNLLLLTFILINKPQHPKMDFKAYIISSLDFKEAQIQAFEKEIQHHITTMDQLEEQIVANKIQLYSLCAHPQTEANKQVLLHNLGNLQEQVEAHFMAHFSAIRRLCTAPQQAKFDSLIQSFPKFFSRPKRPRK